MKEFEIERKFLLRPCSPKRFLHSAGLEYRKYFMQQYYLPEQEEGYVRYRRRDKKFFKTIKSGEGMVREESEYPVSKEEFDSHLENHVGKIIKKERFVFDYEGLTYELDRFGGALKGLCYLEIEFDDEMTAEAFGLPEIFSRLVIAEVTDDRRFNNASISKSACIPALDTDLDSLLKNITSSISPKESTGSIALEPFESSHAVIQAILQNLTGAVEENRKRLLQNGDDPEILHQFRISMRRIRSALGAFKKFFAPSWFALHRRNLSLLMAQTNAKRDIDVLLEKMDFYRSLLPKKMQKELIPLKAHLLAEKVHLDIQAVKLAENELLHYEISALVKPDLKGCRLEDKVSQPIVITAMQILDKRITSILKEGKRLNAQSEEQAYHTLRIQFKKMRYLIEVMEPLVEKQKYKDAMKLIRKMQNILGDFHDYQVQRTLLSAFGTERVLRMKKTKKAMRVLIQEIEKLEEEQEEKFRKKFVKMEVYEKKLRRLFEVY